MKVRAGDVRIAFDEAGPMTGTPLVLLHGFPHDRTLWRPQLRALSAQCRCIAPDLRGFGESDIAPPFSMDRYADDVARLLDALAIERAVIGGLSMGGYVALAFWRRHAERVRALVLADTRAGADTTEGAAKRRAMIELARERGSAAVADAMMTGMIGKRTRARHPDLVAQVRAMCASAPVEGVIGALNAMLARPDSTPTLATIDVPTLIVVGEDDVLASPSESRAMHAAISGSTLEIISGAGHVSNLERPASFNHVVSELMHQVSGAAPASSYGGLR